MTKLLLLLFIPIGILTNGLLYMYSINWFAPIVYADFGQMSYIQAIALYLIVITLRPIRPANSVDISEPGVGGTLFVNTVINPLVLLFILWICKLIIT